MNELIRCDEWCIWLFTLTTIYIWKTKQTWECSNGKDVQRPWTKEAWRTFKAGDGSREGTSCIGWIGWRWWSSSSYIFIYLNVFVFPLFFWSIPFSLSCLLRVTYSGTQHIMSSWIPQGDHLIHFKVRHFILSYFSFLRMTLFYARLM